MQRRITKEEETEITTRYSAGETIPELALVLKRSTGTIHRILVRNNIKRRDPRNPSEETRLKMSTAHFKYLEQHPEAREQRAKTSKELWERPGMRQQLSAAQRKGHTAPGVKERRHEYLCAQWSKPDIREKRSLAYKKGWAKPGCLERVSGANAWNWKGDAVTENRRQRDSSKYKNWRVAVFTRDNYTCQHCGQRGGTLHADHIKPFCNFIESRFDVNNGRTLCVSCHKKTETYGSNALRYTVIGE